MESKVSAILSGEACVPPMVNPAMYNDTEIDGEQEGEQCVLQVGDTCIPDLSTLHEFLKNNNTISANLIRVALWKLYNDTKPETNILGKSDLERVVKIFGDTVESLVAALGSARTVQEVEQDLEVLTGIAENLLFPLLYETKWKDIESKNGKGVAFIVKHLEKAILYVTDSIDLKPDEPVVRVYSTRKNLYCEGEKRNLGKYRGPYVFPDTDNSTHDLTRTVGLWEMPLDSVTLSHDVLLQSANQSEIITIASILYDTLNDVMPVAASDSADEKSTKTIINSRVLSTFLLPFEPEGGRFKNDKVKMKFYHKNRYEKERHVLDCSFWRHNDPNDQEKSWQTDGCLLQHNNSDGAECECDHLTSFAVLMTTLDDPPSDPNTRPQTILMYIGLSISTLAAVILVCLTFRFPQKDSDHYIVMRHVSCGYLVVLILIAFAEGVSGSSRVGCQVASFFLHYMCIAVSLWVLIENLALFVLIKHGVVYGYYKLYIPVAWSVPILPVLISSCVNFSTYGSAPHCWISFQSSLQWAFSLPNILILLASFILTLVAMLFVSTSAVKEAPEMSDTKASVRNNLVLQPLLLAPWLFAMAYYSRDHGGKDDLVALEYIFIFFYSLQGFFFVLLHIVGLPSYYHLWGCKKKRYRSKDRVGDGGSEAGPDSPQETPKKESTVMTDLDV